MEKLQKILEQAGIFEYGLVDTETIQCTQDVRDMCEVNTCRQYGKNWACPPATGTVDECQQRLKQYEKMLLFSVKYDLEDSFDYEGMQAGAAEFKKVCREVDAAVRPYLEDYLILSNGACSLCKECTCPDAPCRFPKQAYGSLEGYGIFASELAKQAGLHYINCANTVTYFGAVVCRAKDMEEIFSA